VLQGSALLLIGRNGAGKSTLLRGLAGLSQLLLGSGSVAGVGLGEGVAAATLIKQGCRYLPQYPRCFELLTREDFRSLLGRLHGLSGECSQRFESRADPAELMKGLSTGQRRLESLNMLLCGSPRLFLLDEPLSGIDLPRRQSVLDWIEEEKARGTAFVIAEHAVREISVIADACLILRGGHLVYSGSIDVLESDDRLGRLLL
jgi:ABC-type multidrug transport system ATPase subunit